MQVLIYSGDHDMCVPHTGSEAWTASLKLPAAEPWRPWLFDDSQVAGYVKRSMRMSVRLACGNLTAHMMLTRACIPLPGSCHACTIHQVSRARRFFLVVCYRSRCRTHSARVQAQAGPPHVFGICGRPPLVTFGCQKRPLSLAKKCSPAVGVVLSLSTPTLAISGRSCFRFHTKPESL